MPGCCIENCKNRSEKGFRLFRVPTGDRRKEWLQLIGKETLPERAVICEVHISTIINLKITVKMEESCFIHFQNLICYRNTAEDKDKDKEENNSRNSEFSSDVEVIEFRECEANTTTNIINAHNNHSIKCIIQNIYNL
ncbi:uncharacterized protein [Mycetomoellerius zeteki]|uniref:uncharacterized protein n=1 Tax=Mycetomoellerius zeteki TaxID=64791 RepID=UPI00084E72A2|nr:PREDICTED: uncharacterized protein LOC108725699 [Trachymyrmex zeteki]